MDNTSLNTVRTGTLEYLIALSKVSERIANPVEILSRIIDAPIDYHEVVEWMGYLEDADLRRLAYHEAGHAVIGHVLGQSIGKITIVPDLDEHARSAGVCTVDVKHGSDLEEKQLLVKLAGRQAEKIEYREIRDGYSSDLTVAVSIVNDMVNDCDAFQAMLSEKIEEEYGSQPIDMMDDLFDEYEEFVLSFFNVEEEKVMRQAEGKAEDLLRNHWPAVDVLARTLLKCHYLSGDEAHEVIRESLKGTRPKAPSYFSQIQRFMALCKSFVANLMPQVG